MKGSAVVAAVAALTGGASASRAHRHAHAHDLFREEKRGNSNDTAVCVPECSTYYTTIYGEPTFIPNPPPPKPTSAAPTTEGPATVPTPIPHTITTPGTYTFPETTLVLTETVTFCPATTAATTTYPPGTYTAPELVTTITETSTVVYCPLTSSTPSPVPTTAPTTPAAPVEPPVQTTAQPSVQPPVEAPVESSTSDVPAPSASSTPPTLGGGDLWAMTYTPYSDSGMCKSKSEVASDIAAIKKAGFKTVRVYSTDCDTLPNVGEACRAHGIKMIIGVFVGAPGCANGSPQVAEQISAIKSWGQWDLVEMCVVGNEALFNGFCTPSQLKSLIDEVRGVLRGGGCSAPVTTTDTVGGWQMDGVADVICSAVDVVSANVHAYFNGAVLPAEAGSFVQGQIDLVSQLCGGKEGYVMETGWPEGGDCIGVSCPGKSQQASAIGSIKETVGGKSVFFSWTNDPWKQPGACNCERSWGCGDLF